MSKKIKAFLLFLFIFLPVNASVLSPSAVGAATNDSSIVIQPSKTEVKASPGQVVSKTFSVINRSNFDVRFRLVVKDYRQISSDGKIEFYSAKENQASLWLIPQYVEISLRPLSTKDVGFVANVPKDFKEGGYYGAILFEPADSNPSGTEINASNFGELVLLTVTSNEVKATALAKTIGLSTGIFQQGNPVDFKFTMENTGNTHFVSQGKIVLKNWMGREVGNFSAGQLIVYPKTTRSFQWRWTDTPSFGLFRANFMLSDPSTRNYAPVDSVWFFLFPWPLGLGIAVLAGLVLAAVKYRKFIMLKSLKVIAKFTKKEVKVKIT